MRKRHRSRRSLAAFLMCAGFGLGLLTGCGEAGPDLYNVSGNVTYQGKPVPRGVIKFIPDASKNNNGPAGSATIVDGKYDTATAGTGVVGGAYTVVINGFDGNAQPERELPSGEMLFPEFTTQAEFDKADAVKDFTVVIHTD